MNVSDFEFVDRDVSPYATGYWRWNGKVSTSLGDFTLELHDEKENPTKPSEDELRRAAELIKFTEAQGEYLLDIVFGGYMSMLQGDPDWLDLNEVPKELNRQTVGNFLSGRRLCIWRNDPEGGAIYVTPLWDEEHGLPMEVRNQEIVSINGERFELRDGVLRYDFENLIE